MINLWYVLSLPGIIMVFLTALARLDDIGLDKMSPIWHVRRAGFFGMAIFAILLAATPFTESGRTMPLNYVTCIGINALSWVWVSTPASSDGHPPWHMLVTGEYKKDGVIYRNLYQRIRWWVACVWWSFKHKTNDQRQRK